MALILPAILLSVLLGSLSFSCHSVKEPGLELQNLPGIDLDYISMSQDPACMLPLNRYLFEHVAEIPSLAEAMSRSLAVSPLRLQSLFHRAFQLLSSSAGGFGPPLPGTGASVPVNSPKELKARMESHGWVVDGTGEWEKLPFEFRKAVVENLLVFQEAALVFEAFAAPVRSYLAESGASTPEEVTDALLMPWTHRALHAFYSLELPGQVDLRKLSLASRLMGSHLDDFLGLRAIEIPEGFSACSLKSPLGEVMISGTGADTIAGEYLLVIETGGDDLYLGNTASSLPGACPLSVLVDLKGDDRYNGTDHSLLAAILGMTVLLDLEGNDEYTSGRPGLSFALYGSSLLFDASGNDTYISHADHSQAAAIIGAALLVDREGDDHYLCRSHSQAFGGTLGVGIFYDHRGDDRYNTGMYQGPEEIQGQSFIQGAARGRWAEATDGHNLAGGLGIFTDRSGRDEYAAGSFSQGASYYFGLGLFSDHAGDDRYTALSHSQGYAAHFSLAGFFETTGNDSYNADSDPDRITQIMGSGRDFSAGLFQDHGGDDDYYFGNRSMGVGDFHGIGWAADAQGNDSYTWWQNSVNKAVPSLGKETGLDKGLGSEGMGMEGRLFTPRNTSHLGVFLDSGGQNHHIINER